MRRSQNAITKSGTTAVNKSNGDPLSHIGITFCCPRKKNAHAKNHAAHMRHRCRAIRCDAESPPRKIIRTSSAVANAAKAANTK
jgi:hypothetical protein